MAKSPPISHLLSGQKPTNRAPEPQQEGGSRQLSLLNGIARSLNAAGTALWVLQDGNAPEPRMLHQRRFRCPEGLSGGAWNKSLTQALARCISTQTVLRGGWDAASGRIEMLLVPIRADGSTAGIAGFLGGKTMLQAYREHEEVVEASLSMLLQKHRPGAAQASATHDAMLTRLAMALLSAPNSRVAANIAADAVRDMLGATRVCLFEKFSRKWRIASVSGSPAVDRQSVEALDLTLRFEECLGGTPRAGWAGDTLSAWQDDDGSRQVGILVDCGAMPQGTLDGILRSAAPMLAHAIHSKRPYLQRLFDLPSAGSPAVRRRAIRNRVVTAIAALAAGIVLLRPVPETFSGTCELVPSSRGTAFCETPGRIESILVKEGDAVRAGQPLVLIDSSEIQTRLDVALQEVKKSVAQAHRWQEEGDMAAFRLVNLDYARATAEVGKLKKDIGECTISAPLSGIVLTKDLQLRRGEVVQVGTAICEIASLSNWDLQIKINEADAGALEKAVQESAPLPVRFVLQARAETPLTAEVTSLQQLSQMVYPDPEASVVYVTIRGITLPQEMAAEMRPGFSGFARIEGGRAPFVVVLLSKLMRTIRLHVLL